MPIVIRECTSLVNSFNRMLTRVAMFYWFNSTRAVQFILCELDLAHWSQSNSYQPNQANHVQILASQQTKLPPPWLSRANSSCWKFAATYTSMNKPHGNMGVTVTLTLQQTPSHRHGQHFRHQYREWSNCRGCCSYMTQSAESKKGYVGGTR